jgi:hypothetical protein
VDDVSLAGELVREAGTMASEMLRQGLETRYKTSISDVVSAADQAAEDQITRRLAESRPDDGLVGEEGARKAGDGRTWYVDPVDGTYCPVFRIGARRWALWTPTDPCWERSTTQPSISFGWVGERVRPR